MGVRNTSISIEIYLFIYMNLMLTLYVTRFQFISSWSSTFSNQNVLSSVCFHILRCVHRRAYI